MEKSKKKLFRDRRPKLDYIDDFSKLTCEPTPTTIEKFLNTEFPDNQKPVKVFSQSLGKSTGEVPIQLRTLNLLNKIVNEYGNRAGYDDLIHLEDQNDIVVEAMLLIEEYQKDSGIMIAPSRNHNSAGMEMAYAMALGGAKNIAVISAPKEVYLKTRSIGFSEGSYSSFELTRLRLEALQYNPKSPYITDIKYPKFHSDNRKLDNNQKKSREKTNRKHKKRRK